MNDVEHSKELKVVATEIKSSCQMQLGSGMVEMWQVILAH